MLTCTFYAASSRRQDIELEDGNFTIEMWVRLVPLSGQTMILDLRNEHTNLQYDSVSLYSNHILCHHSVETARKCKKGLVTANSIDDGEFHHVAFVRDAKQLALFHDGKLASVSMYKGEFDDMTHLFVGSSNRSSSVCNYGLAHISELRITKGVARYRVEAGVEGFELPNGPFPTEPRSAPIKAKLSKEHKQGLYLQVAARGRQPDARAVLTDGRSNDTHNVWLTPDRISSFFVLDFHSLRRIFHFKVRNITFGADPYNFERSTQNFKVEVSSDMIGGWRLAYEGTLAERADIDSVPCKVTEPVRFVRFTIMSFREHGGGIAYFQAFGSENHRKKFWIKGANLDQHCRWTMTFDNKKQKGQFPLLCACNIGASFNRSLRHDIMGAFSSDCLNRIVMDDPLFSRKLKHARVTCNKDTTVLQKAEFKVTLSKACQCCSVGERVALPRKQLGTTVLQTGTVVSQYEQAGYMIKMDQDESLVPIDLLKRVLLRTCRFAYAPQKPIVLFHRRRWRDAVVQKCIEENENHYECVMGTASPRTSSEGEVQMHDAVVRYHLNEANHMPAIISIAQAEELLRGEFADHLRTESETVVDCVTDLKLRTRNLQVAIECEDPETFAGRAMQTVDDLVEYLSKPGEYFGHDAENCDVSSARKLCRLANKHWCPRKQQKRPVLIRAEQGKSFLVSLLQWRLSSSHYERSAPQLCVPVVVNVQAFVVALNNVNAETATHAKLTIDSLIDFKAKEWHKDKFLTWRYLLQTAFALRWTVVIIDGIDEAAGLRNELERFVWMLIHGGYQVVITCRPNLEDEKKKKRKAEGGHEKGKQKGGKRTEAAGHTNTATEVEGDTKTVETKARRARLKLKTSVNMIKALRMGPVTPTSNQEKENAEGREEYQQFLKLRIGPLSAEAVDRKMSEQYDYNHDFFNEHYFNFIAMRKHMDHLYEVQCREDGALVQALEDVRTLDHSQRTTNPDYSPGEPIITQLELYTSAQKVLPLFKFTMRKIMNALFDKDAAKERLDICAFKGAHFEKDKEDKDGKLSHVVFASAETAWTREDGEMTLRATEAVIYADPDTGEKICNHAFFNDQDPYQLNELRMNGKPFGIKTKMKGLANITDIIEGYVVCRSCAQMIKLLERIRGAPQLEIVHLENLFLRQNKTRDHYRMLKLKIKVTRIHENGRDITAHVVQLQVHHDLLMMHAAEDDSLETRFKEYFKSPDDEDGCGAFEEKMTALERISDDKFLLSMLAVCMEKVNVNDAAECPRLPCTLIELYRMAISKKVKKACPYMQDGAYSTIQQLAVYAQCKGLHSIGTMHVEEALCELTTRKETAESAWGAAQRTIELQTVPKTEHGTHLIDCWNKMIKTQRPMVPCFKIIEMGSADSMCQPQHIHFQEFLAAELFVEFIAMSGQLPANFTGQSFKESNLFRWFTGLEARAKVLNDPFNDHFLWLVSRFLPGGMAQQMFECEHMTSLLMARSGLSDDGFTRVLYFLNDRIKSLNVSHNALSAATALCIAEYMKTGAYLLTLDVSNNKIGGAGAETLAAVLAGENNTLTALNMLKNEVGKAGAEALVRAFTGSQQLLTLCGIEASQTELDLRERGLDFGDSILIAADIRKSTSLESVYLNKNEVVGRVWQTKEQVHIPITDGIEALAAALKANKTITHFDISQNQLDHAGAGILATVLETNTTLRSMISSDNCMCGRFKYLDNSYGVYCADGFRSMASALRYNVKSLAELDVSQNFIGNDGAMALALALKFNISLKSLNLSHNNITSEQAGKALSAMLETNNTLTELDLASNGSVEFVDELAIGFERCRLVVLKLPGVQPTAALIDGLSNLLTSRVPTLKDLDISGNVIDVKHSQALAKAVRESVSLTSLTFCGALFNSRAWELGEKITVAIHAHQIDCSNKILGSSGSILLAAMVSKCTKLLSLLMSNVQFGCELSGAKSLAKNLLSHRDLSTITFGGEFRNSKPVTMQTVMTEADFSGKLLGAAGALLLAGFMPMCKSLAVLNVTNNAFIYSGDWEVDYSGIKAISAALGKTPSLVNLNLSNNKAGAEGARCIYEAVAAGSALQYLDMTGNGVSWSETDGHGCKLKAVCRDKGIVLKVHESAREWWKMAKGVGAGLSKKRLHRKRHESHVRKKEIQRAKQQEIHSVWQQEEGLLDLDEDGVAARGGSIGPR
jgi:Ran GTPase-activating protein (RanGAP) involved in mRNA processing and transport